VHRRIASQLTRKRGFVESSVEGWRVRWSGRVGSGRVGWVDWAGSGAT
jgi:hypothetical protein